MKDGFVKVNWEIE
ncbi:Protein of unknown function [Bacillus cereus]|nr:Protein of unknown function [Bacillus cereus]